tara:strand:- start:7266 stop:8195 length:930 start_codon:yes stop_codon:yes gene_type:complete
MTQNNNSILTVGSMAFDSIQSPAGKVDQVLGGSCNYFSIAASFFTPVQLIGVVGNDFPTSHLEWLKSRGINTDGISIIPDGKTFHWTGEYGNDLNEAKTLATDLNVFETFNPQLSEPQKKANTVFLANIDPDLQHQVLDQVDNPSLIACDSMNLWIDIKPDSLKKLLERVDIVSINEGEAEMLTGTRHLSKAAEAIQAMGPKVVALKRGEYGASIFVGNECFLAPAYPSPDVKDPTGAGDSFAGAMMGTLVSRNLDRNSITLQDLKEAVVHGCVFASFTVEDFGPARIMKLEQHEFDSRKETFLGMIRV